MNLRTVGAWITAGAAFWVSLGSLDVAVDGAQAVRVAMLPNLAQLAASLALALAVGAVLSLRLSDAPRAVPGAGGAAPRRTGSGDSFLPLYALSVLILPYLPWLPDRVPVLRVFAGPGRLLVWLVVASQVAWSVLGTGRGRRLVVRMRAWSALRSYLVVFAASALLFGAAAVALAPSGMFPGGDEPHYLIITQSLLTDHDLRIENNHARQDYAAYYDAELAPHAIAPGRDGGTYSVHPVGLPLLAAPAFALGGYPAVVLLMVLIAAAAAALAWRWVRRVTGSVAAATFSWSVTALSVPYLTNSGTVYPEIPAAFAVMVAATVAIRDVGLGDSAPGAATATPARAWRALLLGLATAVLPWLHAKYALMAAVLLAIGVWRIWRDRPPSPWTRERLVLAAAAPFALSVAAWLAFHFVIWGSPWPSAPYGGAAGTQMSAGNLVRGVPGLLVDQEYGILPYAPALALGIVGLWSMWRAGGRARGLAVEIGLALARAGRDGRRVSDVVGRHGAAWADARVRAAADVAARGVGVPGGRRPSGAPRRVPAAAARRPGHVAGGARGAQRRHARPRPQRHVAIPRVAVAGLEPVGVCAGLHHAADLARPRAGGNLAAGHRRERVGRRAARRPRNGGARQFTHRPGPGVPARRCGCAARRAAGHHRHAAGARRQPQAVPVAGRPFTHRDARVVRPAREADRHPLRPAFLRRRRLAAAGVLAVGQAGVADRASADAGPAQRALRAARRALRPRAHAANRRRGDGNALRATSSCRRGGPAAP